MTSEEAFEKWFKDKNMVLKDAYEAWQAALEWAAKGQEPEAWLVMDVTNNKLFVTGGEWASKMQDAKPLYLHPAPIREGWKWVPIEPTPKMIEAVAELKLARIMELGSKNLGICAAIPRDWKAMLDAAPEHKE